MSGATERDVAQKTLEAHESEDFPQFLCETCGTTTRSHVKCLIRGYKGCDKCYWDHEYKKDEEQAGDYVALQT